VFVAGNGKDRIRNGRSLVPDLPLDKIAAQRAVDVFDKLFGALVALSGVAQLQLTLHKAGLRICEPHFTHNGSHACEWARVQFQRG
jgi:hypothetical protein